MKTIVFLLRGAGWAAIGIFVGFVVSYFFRFSGRVDVFALTESMLGIVITGLAIVGAFIVALQWSNLDGRIQAFDTEAKKSNEAMDKKYTEISKNLSIAGKDVNIAIKEVINGIEIDKEQSELLNIISNEAKIQVELLVKSLADYRNTLSDMELQYNTMSKLIKDGEEILNELRKQKNTANSGIAIEKELNVVPTCEQQ